MDCGMNSAGCQVRTGDLRSDGQKKGSPWIVVDGAISTSRHCRVSGLRRFAAKGESAEPSTRICSHSSSEEPNRCLAVITCIPINCSRPCMLQGNSEQLRTPNTNANPSISHDNRMMALPTQSSASSQNPKLQTQMQKPLLMLHQFLYILVKSPKQKKVKSRCGSLPPLSSVQDHPRDMPLRDAPAATSGRRLS